MKSKKIFIGLLLLIAIIATSAATTAIVSGYFNQKNSYISQNKVSTPTSYASLPEVEAMPTDFTKAAAASVNSVVHVKVKIKMDDSNYSMDPFFQYFFGIPNQGQRQQDIQEASGSGVIISPDGYIVTNNHVVANASDIEVTLNDKRTFPAKVIGTDPSTDVALIKIDAKNLPILPFGNSDNLKVGQWVLAVGNPFNLTSTVTAGIISAKARSINIINDKMRIESFIQTDAAVNPGNSGGALVNTKGELVGINTAIASQTGTYTGYSFAIPISIVSKVVADLKQYGTVQRAVLGVQIRDIDDTFAKEKSLETLEGAYVAEVEPNSSAAAAGIKKGDIIIAVNNENVNSVSELQEQIGRYRPGDKVNITFMRKNDKKTVTASLKNSSGNTAIVKATDVTDLDASFGPVNEKLKAKFDLSNGVQVTKIKSSGKLGKAGIKRGFIIIKINDTYINSADDIAKVYQQASNDNAEGQALFISGLYPDGRIAHYAVNLNN